MIFSTRQDVDDQVWTTLIAVGAVLGFLVLVARVF